MVTSTHDGQVERRKRPPAAPSPPRVLVADDDTDLRRMIVHELCAAGYAVIEARTGVELLDELGDALFSGERTAQPDLIVSDIRLPGLFGLKILERLRDEQWRTGMIVMTGFADKEIRERVAGLGAAALFEKPFEVDDLLTAVSELELGWR